MGSWQWPDRLRMIADNEGPGMTTTESEQPKIHENLSFLKDKISQSSAYIGILSGFIVYFVSLFFSWAEARSGLEVSDTGSSSGWDEGAYVAVLPLLYVLYLVIKDKTLSVKAPIISGALSLALLLILNVQGRTTWIHRSGALGWRQSDVGSDLGIGFWIGLLSLATIIVCGISWALHQGAPKYGSK